LKQNPNESLVLSRVLNGSHYGYLNPGDTMTKILRLFGHYLNFHFKPELLFEETESKAYFTER
jgi:hypothetical protein